MELPLELQGVQFLLSVLLGLGYGLHYDLLRGLRRNLHWLTHLLDFWFVLTALLGNLLFALYAGNGEYRIFMFFGSALGLTLWFLTLSRLFFPVSAVFWRIVTFPLRRICGFGKKILEKTKKSVKKLFSSAKKSVKIKRVQQAKLEETNDAPVQIVTHYQAGHSGADGLRHRHNRHASAENHGLEI